MYDKKIDVKFTFCKLIYYYFILSFVVGNGVFVAAIVFVLIFFLTWVQLTHSVTWVPGVPHPDSASLHICAPHTCTCHLSPGSAMTMMYRFLCCLKIKNVKSHQKWESLMIWSNLKSDFCVLSGALHGQYGEKTARLRREVGRQMMASSNLMPQWLYQFSVTVRTNATCLLAQNNGGLFFLPVLEVSSVESTRRVLAGLHSFWGLQGTITPCLWWLLAFFGL